MISNNKTVPDKSLKKSTTSNKLSNIAVPPQSSTNFRKTRSRSLLNPVVPDLRKIVDIDINSNPEPDVPHVKKEEVPSTPSIVLETPRATPRDADAGRRLTFTDVDVFYFDRTSGHSSIPRDGFNTIGMEMRHSHHENMRFNLAKDIFVRRKLFNQQHQGDSKETNSDGLSSTSVKTKPEEEVIKNISDSPTKVEKNHEELSGNTSERVSSKARMATRRSSSYLIKQSLENNEKRKLSSALSVVNIDLGQSQTPGMNRFMSCVNMTPALLTPVQPQLTPKQRGSSSTSPTSRPRGDCGTRGMTPLSSKTRCSLLKSHGIFNIDREEAEEIKTIRESRENCGCSCRADCRPETCECALNEIGEPTKLQPTLFILNLNYL